ncbi:acyltransferase family protein [Neobacillus mesonae]|uniref:acyltransferase family protein n=1 Tax=Neobacillus mesonae TaxID=1193713 RepID=UPI002E1E2286|nr:acyltransferase family protein [Neobacillus mesonae]MED4203987.1 acyltransferase family protein [Neobacillus mesonae]
MASQSRRSKYFDNAKFILIFLVVFGHVISPLKEKDGLLFTLYTFIYLFHMPAFIFISGYFSKGFGKKGYIQKTVKKILLPYVIFQLLYSVYYYFSGKEETFHFDLFQPHWTMWFLLSLFCWNCMLYLFARLNWKGVALSIVLGVGIGYIDQIGSFLSLSRTFVFFPYFLIGFLLNREQLNGIIKSSWSLPIGIIVIAATFLYFSFGFPEEAVPWLLGDRSYSAMGVENIADGLYRGAQYFITILVVFGFLTIIPSIHLKLTEIGERTLYIYLFHGFIIKSATALIPNKGLTMISNHYLILACFSLVVCVFLGSYLVKKYTKPIVEPNLSYTIQGN